MKEIVKKLGFPGNLISASKSAYVERNPKNLVVFNANLIAITEKREILMKPVVEKVWYGDIDITLSRNDLLELAYELQKILLVLRENDARYDKPAIDKFVYQVTPQGEESLGNLIQEYYSIEETIQRNEYSQDA